MNRAWTRFKLSSLLYLFAPIPWHSRWGTWGSVPWFQPRLLPACVCWLLLPEAVLHSPCLAPLKSSSPKLLDAAPGQSPAPPPSSVKETRQMSPWRPGACHPAIESLRRLQRLWPGCQRPVCPRRFAGTRNRPLPFKGTEPSSVFKLGRLADRPPGNLINIPTGPARLKSLGGSLPLRSGQGACAESGNR